MSSFAIVSSTHPGLKTLEAFIKPRAQHYQRIELKACPGHTLILWAANSTGTAHFAKMSGNDLVAISGTFFYGQKEGKKALKAFYNDFDATTFNWSNCTGQFALAIVKNGKLHVLNDGLAAWKLYEDQKGNYVSAGFLEALLLTPTPSFDEQGVYEYAFAGYVLGTNTFVSEIRAVMPNRLLTLGPDGTFAKKELATPIRQLERPALDATAMASWQLDILRERFAVLSTLKADDIASSVSGGFDSRLMIGLLAEQGFKPNLFVYGPESDPDLAPSHMIADHFGLPLKHIDRSRLARPPSTDWPNADDVIFHFDGWKDDGLVGFILGINDRSQRVQGARFMANGKCGEIYRQYYYQRIGSRGTDIRAFLDATFGRTIPQMMPQGLDTTAFQDTIESSFRALTGFADKRMSQSDLEYLYPKVRIPHDAGRDIVINHRFSGNLYPFAEPMLCGPALTLNFGERQYGRLEGLMLEQLDPKLARLPSAYGYDLTTGPGSLYRTKMALSYYRPLWLRTLVPAIRQALAPKADGALPDLPEMQLLQDSTMPYMQQHFKMEAATDPKILTRLIGLELLGQRFGFRH